MMRSSGGSIGSFSIEPDPYKRLLEGEEVDIFGKKIKKRDITKVLGSLSKMGVSEEDEEDDELSRLAPTPKGTRGKAPSYSPSNLYGGMFQLYGGQKVRGGLLGD